MSREHAAILLIEDNPGDARLIREMLPEGGGAVRSLEWVESLDAGLRRIAQGGVDLVLLDLGLPGSTGLETLRHLRANAAQLPAVVVMSSLADETIAAQAVLEGAQDYLVKGQVDGSLLARSIRYAIERNEAAVALRRSHDELENQVLERTAALARAIESLQMEIAERKRTEEALRKSAEEIQDLYNNAPCGYHLLDKDGVFVRINDTELSWLGYPRQEIQGKVKFSDFLTPESSERFQQEFQAFKKRGFVRDLDLDLIRKDGTGMPVLLNATAVKDAQGNFMMSRSAVHDITELKRAQKAAGEEPERLKFIFDSLNIGICLSRTQRDGSEIRMINDAHLRIAGIRREEDTPETWRRITHPDDRARQDALVRKAEAGKTFHYSLDKRYIWADGQIVWVIFSKGRRELEDGGFEELTTVVDITDRKRAEDEIRKLNEELEQRVADRTAQLEFANKELEAFAYSVSHDLRAPLRSIDGFSKALLDDYADKLGDEGKENLMIVRSASQRMAQLIDDILHLSRITRSQLRLTPVDLSALAAAVVDDLKQVEPGRQVEFVIEPGCMASADANLLRIALENLIGNAWKFTGKKTDAKIEFGRTTRDGVPAFFVRDNGAGFDMAYADKMFGAFQRLHCDADFPGTGVGLATVHRIIQRHGGRVWAEGDIGHGATFYFSLPPAT